MSVFQNPTSFLPRLTFEALSQFQEGILKTEYCKVSESSWSEKLVYNIPERRAFTHSVFSFLQACHLINKGVKSLFSYLYCL